MSILIPVKYHKLDFPFPIETNICEIAGNFDIENISANTPYSLHTEYSYGKRNFNSKIIKNLEHITSAQKKGIPQLWYNKDWADDFLTFIKRLIGENKPPEVLEIHPPFNNYSSFDEFLNIFKYFHDKFKEEYSKTAILIENRYGTMNINNFILSTYHDVLKFCEFLSNPKNSNIDLKIVLDYPQIFSAIIGEDNDDNTISMDNLEKAVEKIKLFNHDLKNYREIIGGFHMWGKLKKDGRWIPHAGNFDTFFSNDNELKQEFLKSVSSTFNDGIVRYFVPEVNSSQNDLHSIVADMEETGFIFLFKNKSTNNKKFNDFHIWDIKIPEKNIEYRESGFFEKRGWLIQFCFGEKNGKEYMDVYYSHRMTNDRHDRIYEDGTGESLQAFPDFYPIDPDDPVNNKKLEEENNKMINEIKNNLREKGFYPFPDVNNLVSNINNYIKNNM